MSVYKYVELGIDAQVGVVVRVGFKGMKTEGKGSQQQRCAESRLA